MYLHITQEDIDNAHKEYEIVELLSESCPIYQAAKRVGLQPSAMGAVLCLPNNVMYQPSVEARKFMTKFDSSKVVEPCTLRFKKIPQLK